MANLSDDNPSVTITSKDKTKEGFDSVEKTINKFFNTSESLSSQMATHWQKFAGLFTAAIGSLSFKSFIDAAAEAELQEQKLSAALRSRGVVSQEVTRVLAEQAKEMQSNTIFSDEEIMRAQRFATSIGVFPSKLKDVINVASQLAILYDKDLKEATEAVSLAMEGNTRGLKKMDPQLAQYVKTAKTADDALRMLNERFGADVQAQMDTYTGRVKKFQNQWDEFKEAAGNAFLPALKSIFWYMTEILKAPHKYMPGEFYPFGEDAPEETAKNAEAILAAADKEFKKLPRFDPNAWTLEKERDLWIKAVGEQYDAVEKLNEQWFADLQRTQEKFWKDNAALAIRSGEESLKIKKELDVSYLKDRQDKWAASEEIILMNQRRTAEQSGDLWNDIFNMVNQSGDYAQGMGMVAGGMKGIAEGMAGVDKYAQEELAAQEHYDRMERMFQENKISLAQLEDAYNRYIEDSYSASTRRQVGYASNMFGMMAGAAHTFYQASGQQNLAYFRMWQAFAIAQAIVSTYSAAVKAYDLAMGIGGLGPAIAIMGVAIAAGLAQVAAIASAQPGSTATPSAGVSAYGGTYSRESMVAASIQQEKEARPFTINIEVYGNIVDYDEFGRRILPSINKAIEAHVH